MEALALLKILCKMIVAIFLIGLIGRGNANPATKPLVNPALYDMIKDQLQTLTGWQTKVEDQLQSIQKAINKFHNPDSDKVMIQHRNVLNTNVFRGKLWAQYKAGFGTPTGDEYWLGLEQMHQMTSSGRWSVIYEVVWDKYGYGRPDPRAGQRAWVEFADFKVDSEAENYRAHIGKRIGWNNCNLEGDDTAKFAGEINNIPFSTSDRNNGEREHCVKKYGDVGWWFNINCSGYFCLNCYNAKIMAPGTTGNELNIALPSWYSPSAVTIWIRRM